MLRARLVLLRVTRSHSSFAVLFLRTSGSPRTPRPVAGTVENSLVAALCVILQGTRKLLVLWDGKELR
jgi:hypothetical protein